MLSPHLSLLPSFSHSLPSFSPFSPHALPSFSPLCQNDSLELSDDEDDEEAPWLDAITTLLLGLVEMSHRRYLAQELLTAPSALPTSPSSLPSSSLDSSDGQLLGIGSLQAGGSTDVSHTGALAVSAAIPGADPFGGPVKEEQRAAAYWDAPFALLVQDDSKEVRLEFGVRRVLMGFLGFRATGCVAGSSVIQPAICGLCS